MLRRWGVFLVLVIFVISLSGCATARKQNELEIQRLNTQVSVLQTQLQSKDEEINGLRGELSKAPQEKTERVSKKKIIPEEKSRPSVKHIQIALKNAGYYTGHVDGRIGKQTKEATREFQKANNLMADGKVGTKTWSLLRPYLYKKIK